MNGIIKKMAIAAGCIMISSAMMAQTKALYLSSINGTNVAQYDGQTRNVTMSRSVYNGWNTLCVPFDMTEEELNTAFGSACKLEALTNVTNVGDTYYLNFTDVKSEGVKANTPYLLHYTGENKTVTVKASGATIKYVAQPKVSFTTNGTTISLNGAQSHIAANGQYGIYVKDNADANFSLVESSTSGFYATRCFLTFEGNTPSKVVSLHNEDATAITNVKANAQATSVDGVYNINGVRQNGLQKGVNVVKGKKVYVK